MARVHRLLLALALAPGCAAEPAKDTLLDREFEAYRGDREERRLETLKERYAKAKAEADRLDAEMSRLERQVAARRIRVSDATAAALRLPEPLKVGAAGPAGALPAAPCKPAGSAAPGTAK